MDRPELTISPDAPVAFVDVETTGGYAGMDRVIDVAVIGARGDEIEFEWQSLVNPGVSVPAGITALTGIDTDMIADAPAFESIARELRERLAGRVFVAHNARFDYGFIRREFARLGDEWRSPTLCTVRLSRALYPQMPRHNLDAVIEHHGIRIEHRHRAMPDAQALAQLWRKLRAEWPGETLQHALDHASLRVELPAALPPELPDDLPEAPGVYRFFGEADAGGETLLFVASANNLRERVLDHFRGGARGKPKKLASEVRRVDWIETAGELAALMLEARELRERPSRHNRTPRGSALRFTWRFDDTAAAPSLVEIDAAVLRTGNAFGAFRGEREARRALEARAREHRWCLKLLGLENGAENGAERGNASCVGYHMGRCKGACVGKEPAALHAARVKMGLMPLRLPHWPHAGPVMLREGWGTRQQVHVIDVWQHLGTLDIAGAEQDAPDLPLLAEKSLADHQRSFDMDSYRVLSRYMRTARCRPVPVPLPRPE